MSKTATLYFDGGVRNGKIGIGYVAIDAHKNVLFEGSRKAGSGTSNIAEYRALIAGLIHAVGENIHNIYIIGDSQLIIKQINGAFKISNKDLKKHQEKVLELLTNFTSWSLMWVPRKQNAYADHLVNLAFGVEPKRGKKNK